MRYELCEKVWVFIYLRGHNPPGWLYTLGNAHPIRKVRNSLYNAIYRVMFARYIDAPFWVHRALRKMRGA